MYYKYEVSGPSLLIVYRLYDRVAVDSIRLPGYANRVYVIHVHYKNVNNSK